MKPTFIPRTIVMSIHPEFAEAILRGTKRVELRKTPFPKDIQRVLIYETVPVRYIVGRFEVDYIMVGRPGEIFCCTEGLAGVNADEFAEYYKGKKWAAAIFIKTPERFTSKVDPENYIKNWTPPQSFRYITWSEYDRIVAAGSKPARGAMPPRGSPTTGAGSERGSDSPPFPARLVIDDKEGNKEGLN